ncbi:MAG: ATPase [Deltaproteobacteria bacterium]|jgi:ATP-dependent Zn protease|nr:MAG: ATPase [Deltaproteobacteria bacterium]
MNRDPLKDIEILIKSRYCIIFLDTDEEERAEVLLKHLADHLQIPFFSWTPTKGLRRNDIKGAVYKSTDPSVALSHIEISKFPAVYYFRGFGNYLSDNLITLKLKEAATQFSTNKGIVVITGYDIDIPDDLKPISAKIKLPEPNMEEYRKLLNRIVRDLKEKIDVKVELDPEDINRLLLNLKGLTLMEAEKILTKIMVEDGRLSSKDIRCIVEAKKEIVEREGLLEYYPLEETWDDIADLEGLKSWLNKRRMFVLEPDRAKKFGLSFPKGILLIGVPGCGKSLCAKAVATEWGLPLLKLDPSNLYNKYIGESEKNFKRAIKTAERLSPVILWIDEIEKAFATSQGTEDGGVSTRIFGTFLSWLQERKGDVFIVATANDVTKLPPEFLRKGRFDEVFFLDLPNAEARRAIFEIQLRKRGKDLKNFDIQVLAEKTEGFSGAEIEQVVVSGLYTAFYLKQELSTEILLNEISSTLPLSLTMAERISWLRNWVKGKAVSAH